MKIEKVSINFATIVGILLVLYNIALSASSASVLQANNLNKKLVFETSTFEQDIFNYIQTSNQTAIEMEMLLKVLGIVFKNLKEECRGKCYGKDPCEARFFYCDQINGNYASCKNLCSRLGSTNEDPQQACRKYCPYYLMWKKLERIQAEKSKEISKAVFGKSSNETSLCEYIAIAYSSFNALTIVVFIWTLYRVKKVNNIKGWKTLFFGEKYDDQNQNEQVHNEEGPQQRIAASQKKQEGDDNNDNNNMGGEQKHLLEDEGDRNNHPIDQPTGNATEETGDVIPQQPVSEAEGIGAVSNSSDDVQHPMDACNSPDITIRKQYEQRQNNPDSHLQTNTAREGNNMRPTVDNEPPVYTYTKTQTAKHASPIGHNSIPTCPAMTANIHRIVGHHQDNQGDSGLGSGLVQDMKDLEHARISAEEKKGHIESNT